MKRIGALLVVAGLVLLPVRPAAHDVPSEVRIQAFLKPEGQRLRLLIRVPIAAMNELVRPTEELLLDLSKIEPVLRESSLGWVARRIDIYEGDRRLEPPRLIDVRASLPSDTSFDAYDSALAHVTGSRLPTGTELVVNQALVDMLLEYPIQSDRSRFSVEPRFQMDGLRSVTTLRFLPPSGTGRVFQLEADRGVIRIEPRWFEAARLFVAEGFFHMFERTDHLLFMLCLVAPFRRLGSLVPIVTSFIVAHSITLIASTYDMAPSTLWFPPLIDTLIAASVVYAALENIASALPRRRWIVAFAFGLVHGFGFSFALRDTLQFAGHHLLASLLSFNVGVEIGQLLVLALFIPALDLLFRFRLSARVGIVLLSALAVHAAWHWMTERGGQLVRYPFQWPAFDAAFFALLLQWMILAVVLAGVAWLAFSVRRPFFTPRSHSGRGQSQP